MLREALSQKTKLIIINTPHNPTGKCFTLEELTTISEILKDFPNCVVLADEVYDFLTFDGLKHVPFATIDDNWHKTVSVYSGGKLLIATGWKIGWAIGPERIIKLGGIINNTISYCTNHPGQIAMANSLDLVFGPTNNGFINESVKNFEEVRDYLMNEIKEMDLPWEPLPCMSGYFLMADVTKCKHLIPDKYFESHEFETLEEGSAD